MNRLSYIFAFAFAALGALNLPALAANRYQATITVTNTPTQGLTLTVNGDARTWTTNAPTATQISIGANQSASASNLFSAITGNGFSGPLSVSQLVTNQVRLIAQPGVPLTASLTGGWASLVIVTNAASVATPVTVPISAELTADARTNSASQIILGINSFATNTISDTLLSSTITKLGQLIQLGTESDLNGTSLTNLNMGSVYGVLAVANGGTGVAVAQVPMSFSFPINTINGNSNWITFAHDVVPAGKTFTINRVQSLTDGGSVPGADQLVRIYDVTNDQTLLATNGNWTGIITITNGLRWYARFENNATTNINASASIHGHMK